MKIILNKKQRNKFNAQFHFFPTHLEREREGKNILWRVYKDDKPRGYIAPSGLIKVGII